MSHQLIIRIHPDGRIESQSAGIYGRDCLPDVQLLEQLLRSVAVDSRYSADFDREDEPEIVGERALISERQPDC